MKNCSVNECSRTYYAKGFCNLHYKRNAKHGDPLQGLLTAEQRFWKLVQKTDTCWFWLGSQDVDGYGQIHVNGKNVKAHRYSFYLAHGRWPNACGLHRCDNRACVNSGHIWDGTNQENLTDMHEKNRHAKGESHGNAILKESDIKSIRQRRMAQETCQSIATDLGVATSAISKISRHEAWKHVQ